jgi:glyoxylase-like metal-dependent hydrolase (beta-lactamase superfamily II)
MPAHAVSTIDIGSGIVAIDTEYQRPQQDASHLIVEQGRGAFVDTGTNDSVPLLLDALRQADLDVADVDFVFLTHIQSCRTQNVFCTRVARRTWSTPKS